MGMQVFDVNGYKGDLATTTGMEVLSRYIKGFKKYPCIEEFLELGSHLITEDLLKEMKRLPKPKQSSVKEIVENMVNLVFDCELIAIISDGVVQK